MLKNKALSLFLLFIFLFQTTSVYAFTTTSTIGTFTLLKEKQPAPFDGILLDPLAIASILVDKEQKEQEYKLKLQYELDKRNSDNNFKLSNLQIELDETKKTYNTVLDVKNSEIIKLQKEASNKNDNLLWYIGGSFIGGVLLSCLIGYTFKKL